jgi:hypothetical protein
VINMVMNITITAEAMMLMIIKYNNLYQDFILINRSGGVGVGICRNAISISKFRIMRVQILNHEF